MLLSELTAQGLMKRLEPTFHLIGSIVEGTRLWEANEMDITVQFQAMKERPLTVGEDATTILLHQDLKEDFKNAGMAKDGGNAIYYPQFLHFVLEQLDSSLSRLEERGELPQNLSCNFVCPRRN